MHRYRSPSGEGVADTLKIMLESCNFRFSFNGNKRNVNVCRKDTGKGTAQMVQSAAHQLVADIMISVSAWGDITREDPCTQDEGHAKRMSKDTHFTCNSSEFQRPQQLHAIEAKLHTAEE